VILRPWTFRSQQHLNLLGRKRGRNNPKRRTIQFDRTIPWNGNDENGIV